MSNILETLKDRITDDEISSKLFNFISDIIEDACNHQKRVIQVMSEYDLHDDLHLKAVDNNMSALIDDDILKKLSSFELFHLLAAAYLHDIGMAPSEWEIKLLSLTEGDDRFTINTNSLRRDGKAPLKYSEARSFIESSKDILYGSYDKNIQNWCFSESNEELMIDYLSNVLIDYQKYRNGNTRRIKECSDLNSFSSLNNELRTDYIRRTHHIRACHYIENMAPRFELILGGAWASHLASDIGTVCRSHGEPPEFVAKMHTDIKYCNGKDTNLQFISMMLRLGDIIDFNERRAPLILRNAKRFKSSISYSHWSVKGTGLNYTIENGCISFMANCENPNHYYTIYEYCDWIDHEISLFSDLKRNWNSKYGINIKNVDRKNIYNNEKIFTPVINKHFTLDQNNIIKLLMGVNLYKDPFACIRELYQNALDACRCKKSLITTKELKYNGNVEIGLSEFKGEKYLYCLDNGVGMTKFIIENYLLRIGRSYYNSVQFQQQLANWNNEFTPTSQFSIGILSCFMIGSKIEIVTKSEEDRLIACCIDGPGEYFYYHPVLEQDKEMFKDTGTMVKICLKENYLDKVNSQPINKLGLVLQYNQNGPFSDKFKKYNSLYDIWKNHLYKIVNSYVNSIPNGINVNIKMDDESRIPIYNKPMVVKMGELGLEENDQNFINQNISPRMFTYDKLTHKSILDYLASYTIYIEDSGVEFRAILTLPKKGMPNISNVNLYRVMGVYGAQYSVDGITVEYNGTINENMYMNVLNRFGTLNYTGAYKPKLSIDRQNIISFDTDMSRVYQRIVTKCIKQLISIANKHMDENELKDDKDVSNTLWKYIFDRIGNADTLFVNEIAVSKWGNLKWNGICQLVGENISIQEFLTRKTIIFKKYDHRVLDELSKKLVMARMMSAEKIEINGCDVVTSISSLHHIPIKDTYYKRIEYLVYVNDKTGDFNEYDLISNFYPIVPERLVKALRTDGAYSLVNNSKAILITLYGNNYSAFFYQDPCLIHPSLGLYRAESSFQKTIDSYIYNFQNKLSNFQFIDFDIENCSKKGMMFLSFISPRHLNEIEAKQLIEKKDEDPIYYEGVKNGWTILTTGMQIDNHVIMPGKHNRDEMIAQLSDAFKREYADITFKFLSGYSVKF